MNQSTLVQYTGYFSKIVASEDYKISKEEKEKIKNKKILEERTEKVYFPEGSGNIINLLV